MLRSGSMVVKPSSCLLWLYRETAGYISLSCSGLTCENRQPHDYRHTPIPQLTMSAQIIDGKSLAASIRGQIRERVAQRVSNGLRPPGLAVILVGDDPASRVYVRKKIESCKEAGVISHAHELAANTTQEHLLNLIAKFNQDQTVDGILVQLPLPAHIDSNTIIEAISPEKDVDGFHPYNIGRLAQRNPAMRPCTPYGVIRLLDSIGEQYKGRHAVIVGASNIVGRPMSLELLLAGATVTVCHRFTGDLARFVRDADILVVAVGKPGIVNSAWIKPGATVIDVGINRREDGSLTGDVDYVPAAERAAWITPVPGGVGPMTVAMLLHNTLESAESRD